MKSSQQGLTLIELIIALAVLAMLLGLAVPSFNAIAQSSRLASTSHQVTVSLATARTVAITRGQRVSVCPSSNAQRCTGSHDWTQGWMVFLDPDRTGQPKDAEAVLQVVQRPTTATTPRIGTTPGRRLVRYSPDGMAGGSNLTLSICAGTGDQLLGQVVVAVTGRTRSMRLPTDSPTPCPLHPSPA